MNTNYTVFCVLILAAVSCHRKIADDGSDAARLDEACDAWCQIAVPCSVHFAGPEWGNFSTQAECQDACTANVENATALNDECFDIILDARECAATLSCEDFKDYEAWSFAEPSPFPVPCLEEQQAVSYNCNF